MAKLNAISPGSITKPSVLNNKKLLNQKIFNFDSISFTNGWTDPMQGQPGNVILESLPHLPLLQGGEILLQVGDTFNAITAQNVGIVWDDKYAIHNGVLYEFTKSIDAIIAEQDALGRKLVDNWQGVLVFMDPTNLTSVHTIQGTGITNEALQFKFRVQSTASGSWTNQAVFSIIPWENVNLKQNYVLTVPDNGSVQNPVVGFTVTTVGTTRTAVIRLADNTELSQSWEIVAAAPVVVEDLNEAPERKPIASVNAYQIFETLTALVQPTLLDNVVTWKYRNELGLVQEITLDLTPMLPSEDINVEDFYWDIVDPDVLFLVETDNTIHEVSFAQYRNRADVKPDGSVDLFQGDVLILNLSKVAITNNYNDLINLPIISGQLPPGRKDQIYYINQEGTNEVIPDWMMKKGIIVQTQREYEVATTTALSLEEVFKTWEMFSHFNGTIFAGAASSPPSFPALTPNDPQAGTKLTPEEFYSGTLWIYDEVNDRIALTKNVHPYTGFVSPREYGNFQFEATFSSPNADDDMLALVIGFWIDPITGYEHTLSVVRQLTQSSGQGNHTYRVIKNFTQTTEEVIVDATPLAPYPTGTPGGWSVNSPSRVAVTRTGNIYSIKCSQFGSAIIDDATEVIIDIDLDERLEPFTVATRVAFAARSQVNAYFSDIVFTGLIDYIFFDKGNYYETYEFDPVTEEYFLQNPRELTAKEYFGANRFVESYLFDKIYHITGNDDIICFKGDEGVSWDADNALSLGSDLKPFLNVALLGGSSALENKVNFIDVAHVQNHEYDVTASWLINGNSFTLKKRFNHGPADATNNTIYNYALGADGDILALTDGPGGAKATVDPTTQLEGTFIIIEAATTQPAGITSALVYNENAQVAGGEFNTANYPALSTRFNLASGNIPSLGNVSIEGTGLQLYDAVEFTPENPFPISNFERFTYDFFQKPGNLKGTKAPTHRIQFYGTDAQGAFMTIYLQDDPTFTLQATQTFQNLAAVIPATTIVNVHQIRFINFVASNIGYGFYLDNIVLKGGVNQAPQPSGDFVTTTEYLAGLDTKVDKVPGKGLSDTNYTQAEKDKLEALKEHFKGLYTGIAALETAHPTALAGDYADVDTGPGTAVKRYIYDVDDAEWIIQAGTVTYDQNNKIITITVDPVNLPANYTDADLASYLSNLNGGTGVTIGEDEILVIEVLHEDTAELITQEDIDASLAEINKPPITVSTSRLLTADDNKRKLLVTAPITLTWPAGGITPFECNFDIDSTGQLLIADQAGTPGDDLDAPDGKILEAGKMAHAYKRPDNIKLRLKGSWTL